MVMVGVFLIIILSNICIYEFGYRRGWHKGANNMNNIWSKIEEFKEVK
jgi:hypothetical protein